MHVGPGMRVRERSGGRGRLLSGPGRGGRPRLTLSLRFCCNFDEKDSQPIFVLNVILLNIVACYWYILQTKMIIKDY